ncbi:hypothetical protein AVEN_136186-1 [Araneus ventricosus]|uniref:Uncharacterized protein n=1 Tax=Araneus ventricosus TaxID=182803 RepID=A0A4Y2RC39_ARAVE|nr:hypothetical protein AVEN_136186-1 [Araneus ventricosus]
MMKIRSLMVITIWILSNHQNVRIICKILFSNWRVLGSSLFACSPYGTNELFSLLWKSYKLTAFLQQPYGTVEIYVWDRGRACQKPTCRVKT